MEKTKKLIFFEGIEDNSAFSFTLDEVGRFVPVKMTVYTLFCGEIYPFVAFEQELASLNQYAFEVSRILEKRWREAACRLEKYRREDPSLSDLLCTPFELRMGAEDNLDMWETIAQDASRQMTALFYSFLERALHRTCLLIDRRPGEERPRYDRSKSKIVQYFSILFGEEWETRSLLDSENLKILEMARKVRNDTMHGAYEDAENRETRSLPFRLTELIDAVSYFLWAAEKAYSALQKDRETTASCRRTSDD